MSDKQKQLGGLAEDPDAPASEEELAASARLRDALEKREGVSAEEPEVQLARSLLAAYAPRAIDPREHRAIVERAVSRLPARSKEGRVVRVAFGVAAVLTLAAALVLIVRRGGWNAHAPNAPAPVFAQLAVTRSTQSLFGEPFAAEGGESARADRIAMARGADLRENRFARWGVR